MTTTNEQARSKPYSDDELKTMLAHQSFADCQQLQLQAYNLTREIHGNDIYLRGLIELSNICDANCRYCGIRKGRKKLQRYTLSREDILKCAEYAIQKGYGSLALQAGERRNKAWIDEISSLLTALRGLTIRYGVTETFGLTLSLGEQSIDVYAAWARAWKNPNTLRYLLRFETSNPTLFAHLHPSDGRYEKQLTHRYAALRNLRETGYQVGTGVMIGLPGQTLDDLVADIRMYQCLDVDMIGMGPYLVSEGADMCAEGMMERSALLQRSLNMIAVTRLALPKTNIAATTALESLLPGGRIAAFLYGANVLMPNLTPTSPRSTYQLYDNKPGIDSDARANDLLFAQIESQTGLRIALGKSGNALRWQERKTQR